MKISIVTLSFNQATYLRAAIDSVLQQGYPDLDYIVVDPGSKDSSREIVHSYGDRIAHLIFEPDHGASDGLNKGFARATGEIFGFLNADDLLEPGALQRVADFFSRNPQCDIAFGNGHVIDGEGNRLKHYRARDFTARRYFYGGSQWLQQSTFFRAASFRQSGGFNIENRTCWDGELFVTMVSRGARAGYIDADLAGFRIHPSSISGSGSLNTQYRADARRIFRQVRGRSWSVADEVWRYLYRAEGLGFRIASHLQHFAGRGAA
ncbi:MAG: glycosyltransferase family 2 protein [Terracidiphilus sp.]